MHEKKKCSLLYHHLIFAAPTSSESSCTRVRAVAPAIVQREYKTACVDHLFSCVGKPLLYMHILLSCICLYLRVNNKFALAHISRQELREHAYDSMGHVLHAVVDLAIDIVMQA